MEAAKAKELADVLNQDPETDVFSLNNVINEIVQLSISGKYKAVIYFLDSGESVKLVKLGYVVTETENYCEDFPEYEISWG